MTEKNQRDLGRNQDQQEPVSFVFTQQQIIKRETIDGKEIITLKSGWGDAFEKGRLINLTQSMGGPKVGKAKVIDGGQLLETMPNGVKLYELVLEMQPD